LLFTRYATVGYEGTFWGRSRKNKVWRLCTHYYVTSTKPNSNEEVTSISCTNAVVLTLEKTLGVVFMYFLRFCIQGHYLNFHIPRKQSGLINSTINYVENLSCSGLIKHVACGVSISMAACNLHKFILMSLSNLIIFFSVREWRCIFAKCIFL
jgi:hypothetical protein